ncbi:PEP-CTERM sorting domain-containing protein [Aeoliella sp. SH292]|uniref:PEP-CTERM sorting domain-containing protein n=1 Tax=Aeoliella sp. SH292 TaxID=3454464 RepID=UPI003F9E6E32
MAVACCATLHGQIISVNFSENSGNQAFVGGQNIGPLGTDSAFWNNTNGQPNLAAGTIPGLIDSTGTATAAALTWSSANAWYNGDGTADDAHRQSVGYLDDGGSGINVTLSNIPYTNYRVYGLYSSDQGAGTAIAQDMNVNGTWVFGNTVATSVPAYASINETLAATGNFWAPLTPASKGNFWTFDVSGTNTVTITQSPTSDPGRAALSGVIIRNLDAVIFDPFPVMSIDRITGEATLTNNTGATIQFAGLGLLSDDGNLNPSGWDSISANYDQGGSVSPDEWIVLSSTPNALDEATLGAGSLSQGQSISLGNVWTPYPREGSQFRFEYLDAITGETVTGLTVFEGNNGLPLTAGDFDASGVVDALDWPTVRDNYGTDLTGSTLGEAYALGDINGDLAVNVFDLRAFKTAYEAAQGAGSFALLTNAVPEPSTLVVMGLAVPAALLIMRRRRVAKIALGVALGVAVLASSDASAVGIGINFIGGQTDNDPAAAGPSVTGSAGVVPQANWNNVGGNTPATDHDATVGMLLNQNGVATAASVTWSANETWSSTGNFAGNPSADQDRNLVDGYLDSITNGDPVRVDVTGIPYQYYDAYVYVGSDGDNRVGFTSLDGVLGSERYFATATGEATFTSAANYIQATAKTQAGAVASNYILYQDLTGSELNVRLNRIGANVGLHAVQIVQELAPQLLTLQVNKANGNATIRNLTANPVNLDFIEITSASNAIDFADVVPLGTGTIDGSDWEVLGTTTATSLSQYLLDGVDTLAPGASLTLTDLYAGPAEDLVFTYVDTDVHQRTGIVTYVTTAALAGDFNGDSVVNLADYTVWRDNLGAANESAFAPGTGNGGGINASDYTLWKTNFGSEASGSLSAASSVPEPTSLAVLALTSIVGLAATRRKKLQGAFSMATLKIAVAAVISCLLATSASAYYVDRDYQMGDDNAFESPTNNAPMGVQFGGSGPFFTVDSSGAGSGTFADLSVFGPTYQNTALIGTGRTGFGARFDGTNDYLQGQRFNHPASAIGSNQNYAGITSHGTQGYVFPEKLTGSYQQITYDTMLTGGPAINAAGQWAISNSQHASGADGIAAVPASVAVPAANQWYHFMFNSQNTGGDNFRSVLYINGIAVAANDDPIPEFDVNSTTHLGPLLIGAGEKPNNPPAATPGEVVFMPTDFFDGVVDDVEMYVYGQGTNFNAGDFNLLRDNAWIAQQIANDPDLQGTLDPGDVNRDGTVNNADIVAMVAGWRQEKEFEGAHNSLTVGDWETWGWGDMNLDGRVNYSDWFILRANHPNGPNLVLGDWLSGNAVPEPSSLVLFAIGGALIALRRRS